ncbi:hypothetical protein K491DRAFT_348351 [Lophiostoma macrostomum CBS 122681]|uniref:DUF6603 domain-containing protein n=1 Tax=Lophiostoma macrostomum CBS 122681 TaxID=1314788 RepID=A0A6A6TBN6_9PLEO|nr:hypothetical protein K491DRAFT_348351 [Lophiostoma macrostomum CBS 122681]
MAWRVDSYFINVGLGDGAIHILFNEASNGIHKAILVDGGVKPGATQLKHAILKVEKLYGITKPDRLEFDAVVVTHWDEDHFQGMMEMIWQGFFGPGKDKGTHISLQNTVFYCPDKSKESATDTLYTFKNSGGMEQISIRRSTDANSDAKLVCKAVCGTECLGIDFFSGQKFDGDIAAKLKTHFAKEKKDNNEPKNRPIMLCVGADLVRIDGEDMEKGRTTPKNASSIMATLMMWDPSTKRPRVHLYTGGDAEEWQENEMLDWLETVLHKDIKIDAIKAGHHGSHFATTARFFDHDIDWFVYSAAEDYGHPGFSLVFFIFAYFFSRATSTAKQDRIFGTRYPYWLQKYAKDILNIGSLHMNLTTVLGPKAELYLIELERVTECKNIVDVWFKGFQDRVEHAGQKLSSYEIKAYEGLQKFPAKMKLPQWKDLVERAEELAERWGEIQNDTLKKMRGYWDLIGHPDSPAMEELKVNEVLWVAAEFHAGKLSKPEVVYYNKKDKAIAQKMKTQYSQDLPTTLNKLERKTFLKLFEEKGDIKKQVAAVQKFLAAQDASNKTKTKKKIKGMLMMQKLAVPQNPAEPDLGPQLLSALIENLEPIANIPVGGSKTYEKDTVPGGSLDFLNASFGPSKIEVARSTIADNVEPQKLSLTISSKADAKSGTLRFSSGDDALKSQFGIKAGDTTPFGYHRDIEGILLGLEIGQPTVITLEAFLDLVHYDFKTAHPTLYSLVSKLPLQLDPSNKSRCGVWYQSQFSNLTTLRLEAQISGIQKSSDLANFFKKYLGDIEPKKFRIIGTTSAHVATLPFAPEAEDLVGIKSRIADIELQSVLYLVGQFNLGSSTLTLSVAVAQGSTELVINIPEDFQIEDLFTHLPDVELPDGSKVSTRAVFQAFDSIAKFLKPRRLSLVLDDQNRVQRIKAVLQIQLSLGGSEDKPEDKKIPIYAAVEWTPNGTEFSGELWQLQDTYTPLNINPLREDFDERSMRVGDGKSDGIHLLTFVDRDLASCLPQGIPTVLTEASVKMTLGETRLLTIIATLQCEAPDDDVDIPPLWFEQLQFSYFQNAASKERSVQFRGMISLRAAPYVEYQEEFASLRVSVTYESREGASSWIVRAGAQNLQVAHLYTILSNDDSCHAVMNLMSDIRILDADFVYEYKTKQPSSVKIDCNILLGPVVVGMHYKHDADGWKFSSTGKLVCAAPKIKLGALFQSLASENLDSVPEFLRTLEISLADLTISFSCESKKASKQTGTDQNQSSHVVFVLEVKIKSFLFTFLQMQDPSGASPSATTKTKPKRFIRFSLSTFPDVPKLPVIEKLPQPFDEMDFLWINEDLLEDEATFINTQVLSPGSSPLHWKNNSLKVAASDNKTPTVALRAGCHFQLIMREQQSSQCALDYVFGAKKTPPPPNAHDVSSAIVQTSGNRSTTGDENTSTSATAPLVRSSGNLRFKNIGLSMKANSILSITLDAAVTLGPLSFDLIGFGVDLDLSTFKPDDIMATNVEPRLSGLAVAYSQPPALLAGMFVREQLENVTRFSGGLAIGVNMWTFLAGGVYEEHPDYKSVFAFAKLQGPIISFGYAEVNGIVGGFGYNSFMRMPRLEEIKSFPFIAMNSGGSKTATNVVDQMAAFVDSKLPDPWFKAQQGSMWLAGGLMVRAFQTVDVQALVALDLSSDPKYGIFAEAVIKAPKTADDDKCFLLVDIVLGTVYDPKSGILSLQGEIAPNSFIFSQACTLRGQFLIAYFLPSSGHEGDWVVCIGGFHPAFRVPSHYPLVPERVRISWHYDEHIGIDGEAYFAITPQACMAGGRLDMVWSRSIASASFSAYADLLIQYEPLQFQATLGVAIHVSADIGIFWSVIVSADASARVDLHGPPLAGIAEISFWFIDVSIRFGPQYEERKPLEWPAFYRMLKQAKSEVDEAEITDHTTTILGGRLTTQHESDLKPAQEKGKKPDPENWLVRAATFEFELLARFPIKTTFLNDALQTELNQSRDIFSNPMQLNAGKQFQRSELRIDIKHADSNAPASFSLEPLVKAVPGAMFNPYDSGTSALDQPATQPHLMGFRLKPAAPKASSENLPAIAMDAFGENMVETTKLSFPKSEFSHIGQATRDSTKQSTAVNANVAGEADILHLSVVNRWKKLREEYTNGGLAGTR